MRSLTGKLFKKNIGLVCIVLLCGVIAHSTMLPATFKTLDDENSIINNPVIKDFANTGKIFKSSFFGDGHYYRPMVAFTYMIEYHAFGLRPFYYNLDNLALHLMIAVTVFFLMVLIFKKSAPAFITSLLFAVHPVQWEAVANISGRAVILSTLFAVNAAFFFAYYLEKKDLAQAKGGRYLYYVFSLLCFAGGMLSKESAAMLPVLLLSYLVFVKKGTRPWLLVLPYFAIIGVYIFARHALTITATYPWRSPGEYVLGILSFLRAGLTFLRLFVWPVDLHFDRARELFSTFSDPQLWATVAAVTAITVLLWRSRRRMAGIPLFFLSWFCIELFPVSQIVTTIGVCPGYISAAEHFLYMPAVGIFALIAVGGQGLYRLAIAKKIGSPLFLRFTIMGIILTLMFMTARQGYYAQSAPGMFLRTLKYNPHNSRILYSMGLEMVKRERYGEAEQYFRKTLEREPFHAFARHALGRSLHDQGKYVQGLAVYQGIKDAGQSDALLEKNLKMIYPLAIAQYKERLAKEQGNARLHYSLGTVYSRAGQMEKGIEQYLQAVALKPDLKEALFNLASSYEALAQREMAAAFYERLLAIDGEEDEFDVYAHGRLAEIYRKRGEAGEVRSKK